MARCGSSLAPTKSIPLPTKTTNRPSSPGQGTSSPCARSSITPAARPVPQCSSTAASSIWNSPAAGSCRTAMSGGTFSGQHLADEFLPASRLGMIDDFFRGPFLGNLSIGQQKDPVGTAAGKEDFMRDHDQGQPVVLQVFQRAEDFH